MKLKWKVFIVLLAASLLPMAVITIFTQRASRELGESISAQNKQALSETVKREIVSATKNYAMITGKEKSALEFALRLLILEAEKALARPLLQAGTIDFASDFEHSVTAPEDLAPSPTHMRIMEDGHLDPELISTNHPSFFVPSAVARADVRDDITRFTHLSPVLKGIADEFGDRISWIYASLDSGVHLSFPGHGGYPEGYDPRTRQWYIQARMGEDGALDWGDPLTDDTTNQLTFTVSGTFSKPDGSFAGVAALDVPIPAILRRSEISSQWSNNMQSFLVGVSEEEHGHGTGPSGESYWVLSQEKQGDGIGERPRGSKSRTFRVIEDPDFFKLTQNFTNKLAGDHAQKPSRNGVFWYFLKVKIIPRKQSGNGVFIEIDVSRASIKNVLEAFSPLEPGC